MKLEKQVCSLELAKQLKEAGVPQDSLFYWKKIGLTTDRWIIDFCDKPLDEFIDRWQSAFTAAELFELVPDRLDNNNILPYNLFRFAMYRSIIINERGILPNFLVNYECDTRGFRDDGSLYFSLKFFQDVIYDENLANCLAKVLLELIKGKWVKTEKSETAICEHSGIEFNTEGEVIGVNP